MEIYFTKEHQWVKIEGNKATVGITAYAIEQLGDITFVELPEVGAELKQNDVLCTVESAKAASDVYAPMTGKVTEVNTELLNEPEKVNASPEEAGWFAKMEISAPGETANLMTRQKYLEYVKNI